MSTTSPPKSITQHLLTHHPFPSLLNSATQTPFLQHAGSGTLPPHILAQWLGQDRLYVLAYIRFAGRLLAGVVNKKVGTEGWGWGQEAGAGKKKGIKDRLAECVIGAIANVKRELGFFEDVAERYGFNLALEGGDGDGMTEGTRAYIEMFEEVGDAVEKGEIGVLEGMCLLWGTEICYLTSWRYAKTFLSPKTPETKDLDNGAIRNEFIENWTGHEFVLFVQEIEALLEEVWRDGAKETRTDERLKELEKLWERILVVEKEFWPEV